MRERSWRSSDPYPLRGHDPTRYASEVAEDPDEKPAKSKNEQRPPPTPFDHPLFLPVLLVAGAIWFGYDGWINQDPDMLEHRDFNRYGFAVLAVLTGWFGFKGWQEWRSQASASDSTTISSDDPPAPTA